MPLRSARAAAEAAERIAAAEPDHGDGARPGGTPATASESAAQQQRARARALLDRARYKGAAAAAAA